MEELDFVKIRSSKHDQKTSPFSVRKMATVDTGGDNPRHTHGGHAGARPNRLMNEKSPYLLQHAYNPVDWYPWGEEAFAKARRENKLIFLSVGYSTCHWCHVMERESFESDSIAAVMNQYFVNIKVDREERPDVDRLYMSFVVVSATCADPITGYRC